MKHYRRYTQKEIEARVEYLKENAATKTQDEMAEELGVSPSTVYQELKALGLGRNYKKSMANSAPKIDRNFPGDGYSNQKTCYA